MPRLLALCAIGALFFSACDATNETPHTGEAGALEAFSGLTLKVGAMTLTVDDLSAAVMDTLSLDAGKSYTGSVSLGAASDSLVQAEAESHLFAYTFDPASDVTLTATDRESQYAVQNLNGGDYALGRTFSVAVDSAATGQATLNVRLRHFDGVEKSMSDANVGQNDFSVMIPVMYVPIETAGG